MPVFSFSVEGGEGGRGGSGGSRTRVESLSWAGTLREAEVQLQYLINIYDIILGKYISRVANNECIKKTYELFEASWI